MATADPPKRARRVSGPLPGSMPQPEVSGRSIARAEIEAEIAQLIERNLAGQPPKRSTWPPEPGPGCPPELEAFLIARKHAFGNPNSKAWGDRLGVALGALRAFLAASAGSIDHNGYRFTLARWGASTGLEIRQVR